MIPNNEVQAALVLILKADTTITSLLTSGTGSIKEYEYQGEDFNYPALRIQLHQQTPVPDETNCNKSNQRFSILVFDEAKSSKNVNKIMGVVSKSLHKKNFTVNGIRFVFVHVDSLIPAIRKDEMSWRAELSLHSNLFLVSGTYV